MTVTRQKEYIKHKFLLADQYDLVWMTPEGNLQEGLLWGHKFKVASSISIKSSKTGSDVQALYKIKFIWMMGFSVSTGCQVSNCH